ncbi:MAG: metallophosphoesterase [Rhodocyclaceae bacterium]|nr:metallophosphoesterase [Rhodocyclaceae bacterium]
MKIALYSDLHTEFGQPFELPTALLDAEADVIILAGDIGVKTHGVAWAGRHFTRGNVVYVPGNHEYYGAQLALLDEMRRAGKKLGVKVLNNEVAVFGDVRVLGSTLWTSFMLYGPDQAPYARHSAMRSINDFMSIWVRRRESIACDPLHSGGNLLHAHDVVGLHRSAVAFLERELSKPWAGKTVVATHFAPHRGCIAPEYENDALTAYFVNDLAWMMEKYRIDVWAYGHTHGNVDFVAEGGCRVVSNQRGYPREQSTGFRPDLILEV